MSSAYLVSARFSLLPTIATQLSYAQLVVATLYYTTLCKEGGGGGLLNPFISDKTWNLGLVSLVCSSILYNTQIEYTPKTGFSDRAAPFFMFYSLSRLDLVNRLNLVNKRGLITMMAKLSLGCTQLLVQKLSILKNTQFEPTRWISPDSGFCFQNKTLTSP